MMKQILNSFCSLSGQTPNWAKSGIIFSKHVQDSTASAIRQIFPVADIDASFIYLGHPLILPAKNEASAYNFVLNKFKSKLTSYKADMLHALSSLNLFFFHPCLLYVQYPLLQKVHC